MQEKSAFSLNPAQKAAAEAPISPLLIVAGAGTGKTRTLTSRIVYLIETGTPAGRICAITFTNKAAQEMRNRVVNPEPFIGTFHSLGARILRKECRAFGRNPNFVIFDDHDSFELIKKIIKNSLTVEKSKKNTPAFFISKISKIKNLVGGAEDLKESPERKALIEDIFKKYEDALATNNAFDFDDLIQKPVALFRSSPAILQKYRMKFDALFVDEYQDINPKQHEFIKLLAGGHRNLSVVGDDEQTIYGWRYADIKMFLNFEKEWPGAKIHFLEENYRSTGNVIRAASAVAENNRYRTPKKLWTENSAGETISLFEAWGENDEAEWIADKIKASGTKQKRSEVAILYRTNAQSRAIEQALIRNDIPYQIFGGLKFYERREVKDAVAALRWASNDRDEVARERLEKNLSKRKFAEFKNKVSAAEHPGDLKPTDIIKVFLDVFGYFDYLEENFTNADEREENIGELLNFAARFENLPDFLEKIALLQATDDQKNISAGEKTSDKKRRRAVDGIERPEKVNLMTIHLAKGLEFEKVFIAGACEGLLPHIRSIDNEESIEEERRLMYVAMTRAKKKLHISFYGMPSRFLSEIPEECLALAVTNVRDDVEDEGADKNNADDAGSDPDNEERAIALD